MCRRPVHPETLFRSDRSDLLQLNLNSGTGSELQKSSSAGCCSDRGVWAARTYSTGLLTIGHRLRLAHMLRASGKVFTLQCFRAKAAETYHATFGCTDTREIGMTMPANTCVFAKDEHPRNGKKQVLLLAAS